MNKMYFLIFVFLLMVSPVIAQQRLHRMVNGERVFLTSQEEAAIRVKWASSIANRPAREAARKEVTKESMLNSPEFDAMLDIIAPKLSPAISKAALRAQIKVKMVVP